MCRRKLALRKLWESSIHTPVSISSYSYDGCRRRCWYRRCRSHCSRRYCRSRRAQRHRVIKDSKLADAIVLVQQYLTHTIQAAANESRRFAVDYGNVDQIKHVLQENKVDVVVSALLLDSEGAAQSQINLIRAAARSGTVTRFIPTEYYIDFHAPIP